jgi:hypothetical protein
MSKFRVISPTPITLNLLNGKTISASKRMIVEPIKDNLFETARKKGYLVPHYPEHMLQIAPSEAPPAPPAPAPVMDVVAAPVPVSATVESAEVVDEEGDKEEASGKDEKAPEEVSVEKLELAARTKQALIAGGYTVVSQIKAASNEELEAVSGIGSKTVDLIRAAVASLDN